MRAVRLAIRKPTKRQVFYFIIATISLALAIGSSLAWWKVRTIRQAEALGMSLEGTRDRSTEKRISAFCSVLESLKFPESVRKPVATWLLQSAWKTNYIVAGREISPQKLSILTRWPFRNIEGISFKHTGIGLEGLAASGPKPKCRFLDLEHAELDDSCIPVIMKNFPRVEFINFRGVPIEGSGFTEFSNHEGKTLGLNLGFNREAFTREKLETLAASCPQLGYLRFYPPDDKACEPLLKCQELWGLDFQNTRIRGDIVHKLHLLPKLEWLHLGSNGKPNSRDLDLILSAPSIPTIKRLNLYGLTIEENHLPQIARVFPNLEELWLPYATLPHGFMTGLTKLPNLQTLNLYGATLPEGKPIIPIPARWSISKVMADSKTKELLMEKYPSLKLDITTKFPDWINPGQHPFLEEIDY